MELREKAFELFKESNGNMSSKKIADALGIDLNKVKYWRRKDNWKDNINRSRGAPKRNKNAIGNNGGAPKGNLNNFKHGMYIDDSKFSSKNFLAKYIPAATKNIIGEIEDAGLSSLDILWMNITTQLAAIIRSQKIMHVKSKNDLTKVLKKETWGKNPSEEYELQFAWDKQANFLQAQSKAMKTLEGLINSYEKLLHTNWDLASEEQKTRVEKLKAEVNKLTGDNLEIEDTSETEDDIYGNQEEENN
ncbi:phage terminase small subunit [Clostridium perfringens]|uniref:phage terminase small subunit n=1 Tax=Clostridium perfringens TaxID=1502 RepID=UPI00016BD3B7|nr:phage terminase small subunit [Clostridium perfringens]EDT26109.1 phage protein [Clostridium perfringens CPE str. F4969]